MKTDQPLEIRYWVAQRLRPNSGFEDYFFGLDEEFVERIDSNWKQLFHILNRPFLLEDVVKVTNL